MAQSYVDPIGGELVIPGAYPSITVAPANGGLATTGVVVLMGEADAGDAFDEETELGDNQFSPDTLQSLIAKYKSGPLVDAARAMAGAAVDVDITNTFYRVIPVKTNTGGKATSALTIFNDGGAYPSFRAKSGGTLGNLIYYTISNSVAPVYPQTGLCTYIPQPGAVDYAFRYSGGGESTVTVPQDTDPAAAAALLSANGGTLRTPTINNGVDTIAIAIVTPGIVTLTLSVDWTGVSVGDTLYIIDNALAGAGTENFGWYVITAVAGGVITATKLSDHSTNPGHVNPGDLVLPVAVPAAAVTLNTDFSIYAPLNWIWGGGAIDGQSASMEIACTSFAGLDTDARNSWRQLGSTAKAAVISVTGAPVILTGTDRKAKINIDRKVDNISEEYIIGGEVGLKVGYQGYSANLVIDSDSITATYQLTNISPPVSVVLGFAQYPTIADVAAYLSSLTGWTAAPGTAVLGNLPTSALDAGVWFSGVHNYTYNCATTNGGYAGRVLIDAYRLRNAIAGSYLVEFVEDPLGGLPSNVTATTFLAGGTKGATTAARITAALTAMEQLRANFIVPCFSRDASADIADGLTDASSTYQIDAINAAVKSHVHKMSGMKVKRNRQAFLSKRDTFEVVKESAANTASHRCMMAFQDVKNASSGAIVQYQPYITAALAAAMQAGAFYKSLVRKQVAITGAIQAAGDFTYNYDSNIEDALKAGLNPIKKAEEGGFVWVSDQTTYGKDNKNFYNSIQMVYAGDIVALTTAQRMERAFVGQSVADVSASLALSYLDSIMADFMRLKLIAPSSDAPLGYRNAVVVIEGAVMRVSVEVKIAGSIYFIPIAFYVTEITQSA